MSENGIKISGLPAASSIDDSDVVAGVQSSTTKRFAFSTVKSWIKNWIKDWIKDWITKSDVGLGNVENVLQYSSSNPPQTVGTISVSASWTGTGPYTQTITVTGATVTAASKVDLQLTAAQIASLIAAGVASLAIENNAGTLTLYAVGASPSVAMTVQCTVEETQ